MHHEIRKRFQRRSQEAGNSFCEIMLCQDTMLHALLVQLPVDSLQSTGGGLE